MLLQLRAAVVAPARVLARLALALVAHAGQRALVEAILPDTPRTKAVLSCTQIVMPDSALLGAALQEHTPRTKPVQAHAALRWRHSLLEGLAARHIRSWAARVCQSRERSAAECFEQGGAMGRGRLPPVVDVRTWQVV